MNTPTAVVRTLLEDDLLDIRGMVDELFDLDRPTTLEPELQ